MKNQLHKIRRLFIRTRKFNAASARAAIPDISDHDDDGENRLSGAFIVVLFLHIVAVIGVFAFAKIKDSRGTSKHSEPFMPTAAAKPEAHQAVTRNTAPANPLPNLGPVATPIAAQPAVLGPRPSLPVATGPKKIPAADDATSPRLYKVRERDNPVKIARENNCSYDELIRINNIKDPKKLKPGQVLKLPPYKG